MPKRPLRALFILTFALIAVASPSSAAVLEVPTLSYPTIQSAIDAASPGDTITVSPGTYFETLTIQGMTDLSLVAAKIPSLVGAYSAGSFVTVPTGHPKINGSFNSGSCVTIIDSFFISIVGFEIEICDDAGIDVIGTGNPLSQDIEIHGNYIHNVGTAGVRLDQVYRIRVTSNWIENADNGITALAKGSLFADNHLNTATNYGIHTLDKSGINRVIGNSIGTSGIAGILDDGQGNRFERNTVSANFTTNIEIGLTASGSNVIGNAIFSVPVVNNGSGSDIAENQ